MAAWEHISMQVAERVEALFGLLRSAELSLCLPLPPQPLLL